MREQIFLNDGWEFTEEWTEAFKMGEKNVPCRKVRLPHTVRETPYDYFDESICQMVCGYRRIIRVPASWSDKRVRLTAGAAGHSAEIWLNGKKIAEHHCGYTAFSAELNADLLFGEDNILAIRVDSREQQNIPPFGFVIDYMTYGGMYREAWLDISSRYSICDAYIRPEVSEKEAAALTGDETARAENLRAGTVRGRITGEFCLTEECLEKDDLYLRMQLLQDQEERNRTEPGSVSGICGTEERKPLAERQASLSELPLIRRSCGEGSMSAFVQTLAIPEVKLWDTELPVLYTLRTELVRRTEEGDEILDAREVKTGFRKAIFRKDGFYLNGRRLKLRGLNRHQSWPYVGYAMPASLQRMDADILKKELGLNAVRTSHYPQSQDFISRCDENGLLVFTEIPGWQHIGDEQWKQQAIRNTEDMVLQYRNHPSIILWGVRINESLDDDAFYTATNAAAHSLDPDRQTSGVRYLKKSHLLEDVYAYNDFIHSGENRGCDRKNAVTSDPSAPYLISEYNGHMYPTKMFDSEAHRREHFLRHARVLDSAAGEDDIAGSFGWCMADYNTHREFGSGDRICYHGVLDMFRNPKPAAAVYAAQQEEHPVLEITSCMDIGEQPAGRPGEIYVISNADEVRVYRNDCYICTLQTRQEVPDPKRRKRSGKIPAVSGKNDKKNAWPHLAHPPVQLKDFIGDRIRTGEGWSEEQAEDVRYILNYAAIKGFDRLPPDVLTRAAKCLAKYHMSFEDAYQLFGKYIGTWGDSSTVYRFDAVNNGQVVKSVVRQPVQAIHLEARADHTDLTEGRTYDAAAIRITMCDQDGNMVPFFNGSLTAEAEGPLEIIGPKLITLRGGCGGTYVRTTGNGGDARVILRSEQVGECAVEFRVYER